MQIRTLFHNANFLKKSTRRNVCVLLMLVACVSAAWGAQFRLKNASATGEQSWDSSSTWQDSSLGISWGNADNPPTSSDRVYLQGAAGVETVIRLTSSITVDQLIINSDNAAGGTIRFVADAGVTITVNGKLCLGLPDNGGTVNLVLDNVSLSCSSLEVNDDVNDHHKNDGNLVISGTGTAQITAGTVNVFADKASSPGAMSIDFGNVPLSATSMNVNSDAKTGGVTINTDSTIDADTVTIGGSNPGNTNTTFGGTGSIDVDTWGGNSADANVTINPTLAVLNDPTDPYTYTITVGSFDGFCAGVSSVDVVITATKNTHIDTGVEWQIDLPFSLTQTGSRFQFNWMSGNSQVSMYNPVNDTYTATVTLACNDTSNLQDGDGFTLKIYSTQNVLLKTIEWHYEVPDAYSFTATGVDTFTGSGDNNQIDVRITSAVAGNSISYTFERSETSTGDAKFTLNDLPNTTGSASFNSSPYEKNWPIKAVQPLEEGDGFTLTVKRSDGSVLGTVTWTKPGAKWTGAVSSDWNTLGNWSGITSLAELETKDVTIDSSYTRAPEISSTATVKSLTIAAGKQVTLSGGTLTTESLACEGGTFYQTGGTLTAGSIACTGAGSFLGTGGTVSFNGTAGTWSAVAGTSVFNNVTLASGAALTMSSPLHLTGNLDVSEGTLTAGATVVFEGSGTQASPQTLKASSVPFGSLTFAGDGSSGYIKLLSNVMCSTQVTLDEDITLDCNGYMLNVSAGTLTNNGTIICSEGASAGMLMCGTYEPSDYGTDVVSVSGAVTLVISDGEISTITVTDTAEIAGSAACSFFTATGLGGKTLNITGQLIIGSGVTGTDATETLKLSGTSSSSKLEIAGAGSIKLNTTQVGGQYLNVSATAEIHDLSSDTVPIVFTATNSTGTAPSGWNICSGDLVYVWTGAAGSTTWSTPGNWSVGMSPSGTSDDVEIPAGLTIYPVSPSSTLSINSLKVESGASVSVADGNKLRFVTYSGDGVIKLGTGNIEIRSAGTNCTIQNIEFTGTGTRSFADINKVTLVNLKVPSGKTLQLSGDLTLTGSMDNSGTINTNGKTLTFKTYTGDGTVQIGAAGNVAVGSSGTGGTIKNVVFTGTRGYVAPANITFTDGTINSGVTLTVNTNLLSFAGDLINKGSITLSSAGLTVSGNVDNQGTVNCNNRPFTLASYSNSRAGTVTDKILTNGIGGSVTCTGSGTGSGAVTYAELNGSTGVTNSGTGALTFTKAILSASGSSLTLTNSGSGSIAFGEIQVNANATLTTAGAGSAPAVTKMSVNNTSTTFTLNSALTVTNTLSNSGTLNASGGALSAGTLTNAGTLNATGGVLSATTLTNTGTLNSTGGALTVTGSLTNSGSVTSSGGALSVTGTLTNQSAGTVSCNGFDLTAGTLANSGSVSLTAATGGSSLTCTTYTPSGSDSMTLSGDVTLSIGTNQVSTINYSGGTLTAGAAGLKAGTLNVTAGPAKLAGTMNVTTLSIAGSTTVSGTVKAGTCRATGLGGKSFTVNGTLEVYLAGTADNPAFKLEGTSESSRLNVSGSGIIKIYGSQVGGNWLSVSTSGPSIKDLSGTDSVIYTATYSVPSGGTATEFNGWNICNGALVFEWKGGDGSSAADQTDWNRPKNWTVRIVPNSSSAVDIPASASYDVVVTVDSSVAVLSLGAGKTLTLDADLSVSGLLANNGTVDMKNRSLTCGSYADDANNRWIKLGAGNFNLGTGGTVNNIEFTASRSFGNMSGLDLTNGTVDFGVSVNVTSSGLTFSGTLTNNGTITQNGNLSVNGALTNNGTINMQNNSLSCGSYTDDGNNRWIKLGTGTFNPGTGGTLNNIEFTASRDGQGTHPAGFEDIANLTIKNGTVDPGVALTITSGGLSFTGNFENNGNIIQTGDLTVAGTLTNKRAINIGSNRLRFGLYLHTGVSDDTLTIADGSVTASAGGNGTGMISVSSLTMNGNATVTNNGSGALKFASATANANVLLTSGGSGSAPVFSTLTISGSNTLTLASHLTAGTIVIESSATLKAGPDSTSDNTLTVTGDFINNNTTPAETDDVVYRGFIPQSGMVVFTGNGGTSHHIKGNIQFNDFYCHEAGAKLIFDTGTTINVDHQIDVEGTAGHLIEMTTDSTAEGEKWTLDIIWDVAAGTSQHPKPKIKYVAPHKSISYSAILKGCLDNCIDDASDLRDSTNVNWFDDMPTILMTLAPVGGHQLFVLFSTEVSAAPGCDLRTAVSLKTGSGANLIDSSVPVTNYTGTTDKSKTGVIFGLTRDLTWDDLFGTNCLHVEIDQTSAVRVGTTRISYQQGVKHSTSDFAVNAARMLFGYDNYIDSSTPLTIEKGTNSVRTWDQSDPISNRLHSDSDLLFQTQLDGSVPADMKLEMVAQYASELNADLVGDNFTDYYGLATRLWLPEPDNFLPLSTAAQTLNASQKISQDSTSSGRLRNFSLHYSKSSSVPLFQMRDGEEIQFLFKVKNADGTDLLIDHDYDEGNGVYTPSARHPVYAIRLVDDSDITSFDLWSVMLQSTTMQRGNVTILNNVINADKKEQTFITIQTQKAGSLTVQVLTLDGSVITTLERGRKQAGTYGYSWDGTNGKGKPVARGMYFIRVIGPDIDETRKVMVVRD